MQINFPKTVFFSIPLILTTIGLAQIVNSPNVDAQGPTAAGSTLSPQIAEAMKGKTAGEYYKNVQILKDIPAGELVPTMEYVTTALGVECGYCHAGGFRFDSDEKREKNVARNMMKMTIALNQNVFDGKREITCYTCHRGAAKGAPTLVFPGETAPTERTAAEIIPPLVFRDAITIDSSLSPSKFPASIKSGPLGPIATSSALPAADDVFNRYWQALGGMAAISKVNSLVEKGAVEMLVPPPPQPRGAPALEPAIGTIAAEIDRKLPGKLLVSLQFPGRTPNLEGSDGTINWNGLPRELTGGEMLLQQEVAELPPGLRFKENHSEVQVDAIEKIGDREAYRVVGTRRDGSTIDRLYFDVQSGLLLRSYTTLQSVLGGFPEETNYGDYREVSGFKVAFTVVVLSPAGNRTYKWSRVDVNVPVDDARFAKPLPPSPPQRAAK